MNSVAQPTDALHRAWGYRWYRGEAFPLCEHYYVSAQGEAYTTARLDHLNVVQVHNAWREKYGVPFPTELRAYRSKHGLLPSALDERLGFVAGTWAGFEAGQVPELRQALALQRLLMGHRIVAGMAANQRGFAYDFGNLPPAAIAAPNAYNGYTAPDFDKAAHTVLFFAQRLQPRKTRLNKLLYFSDFQHFSSHGNGLTGLSYRAIQHGPVPARFQTLFDVLAQEGYVAIAREPLPQGEGERFVPLLSFNPELFSPAELATLEAVAELYGDLSGSEIVEISHTEPGWLANHEAQQLISYAQFAFER